MRISSKGEYGLLAIADLAMQPQDAAVQATQIAKRQGVPKQYLDQLMMLLRKSGLIESVRGRQGGYRLARPADAITLLDVVVALEGPQTNVNFKAPKRRKAGVQSVFKEVWETLSRESCALLHNKTVADICREYQQSLDVVTYEI